jgi:hypothetical protein
MACGLGLGFRGWVLALASAAQAGLGAGTETRLMSSLLPTVGH